MNDLYVALAVIGGLVLVIGLVSSPLRNRTVLTDPLLALVVGVVLGPYVLGVMNPAAWGQTESIVEEAARLTLAIGLMAIALRLPGDYFGKYWRGLAALLGLMMPIMWLTSSLLAYWLLPLPFLFALLIGAIITPTDPIVASSLVTAKSAKEHLPAHLRHTLSAESGFNDGLAMLFVFLPILLLTRPTGEALSHWLTTTLLWEVIGGIAVGALIGYAAGRVLHWSERHDYLERASFLSYTVALALLTVGVTRIVAMNDILAVFVAGVAFDAVVSGRERAEEANIQETVNQFFSVPIFALLGLMLPIDAWIDLGWRGVVLVLAVLLLRRLPALYLLRRWIAPVASRQDAVFAGWFGPIGVSALLYAMLALERTGDQVVWTVSSLVIVGSIIGHGMTATPFINRYEKLEKHADSHREER